MNLQTMMSQANKHVAKIKDKTLAITTTCPQVSYRMLVPSSVFKPPREIEGTHTHIYRCSLSKNQERLTDLEILRRQKEPRNLDSSSVFAIEPIGILICN